MHKKVFFILLVIFQSSHANLQPIQRQNPAASPTPSNTADTPPKNRSVLELLNENFKNLLSHGAGSMAQNLARDFFVISFIPLLDKLIKIANDEAVTTYVLDRICDKIDDEKIFAFFDKFYQTLVNNKNKSTLLGGVILNTNRFDFVEREFKNILPENQSSVLLDLLLRINYRAPYPETTIALYRQNQLISKQLIKEYFPKQTDSVKVRLLGYFSDPLVLQQYYQYIEKEHNKFTVLLKIIECINAKPLENNIQKQLRGFVKNATKELSMEHKKEILEGLDEKNS